jgi:hypothetical protein
MGEHHLVLGELTDFLSGRRLPDTHDERHRQDVARILVEQRSFARDAIRSGVTLTVEAGDKRARVRIDFIVHVGSSVAMVIKYGPGSITTRHRIALAAAYLLGAFRVPICVVTNGRDADVLTSADGRVVARGLAGIPSRQELEARLRLLPPAAVTARQAELAARVLYAYEVDDRCPCDDTVCERVW